MVPCRPPRVQSACLVSAIEIAVFYTIAAAVMCWALGEAFESRPFWTAGGLLALAHAVAAFLVFYEGSHETARIEIMKQTAASTGFDFPGGIYVNYAFLATWLGDAAWWWADARGYRTRPRLLSRAIRGFIFLMIVNGAIVFADGLARLVGLAAVSVVVAFWLARRTRPAY